MDHQHNDDLAGQYLHDYDDGEIGYQGQIIAVEGKKVRVQLFSWRTGQPADIASFTKAFIKKCRLYADRETWASTGIAEKGASRDWRRWHPPTERPIAGSLEGGHAARQEKSLSGAVDLSVFA